MPNYYSEKQIEAANMLSSVTKDGVPAETIDEIVNMIGETEQRSTPPADRESDDAIRLRLLSETDWRKKASLAAMLISRSLE